MSSREIAELVEKRHDNVKRTISDLANSGVISYPQIEGGKKAANGVVETVYLLEKRDSFIVVAQLSPEFTARLVDRWQALEDRQPAPIALSTMDILHIAMESEKGRLLALEQRDHAIATKAHIGSKREATAMATASAAKKESAKLKEQLGFNAEYATVTAVQNAMDGEKFDWLPMRRWCKTNGVLPKEVQDQRFGKVKAWPAGAWWACHVVSLDVLFGEVTA